MPSPVTRPLPGTIKRAINTAAHQHALTEEIAMREILMAKARAMLDSGMPVADVVAALAPPALPVLDAQPLALKTWCPTAGHHASP